MELAVDVDVEDYFTLPTNESLKFFDDLNDTLKGGRNGTGGSPGRDENLAKVEIAVLALIFIATVLGNFIVLLGIYFRRQKMSRMYYFLLHLSIADLITAFFNVLTQLAWELTWHFQGGNLLCKFVKYAQILGPYSSSYVLVMTAVDRYQAICFPLSNCTWTARRSKIMLGCAWTLSVLLCIPQLFIFSYMEVSPGVSDCWATFAEGWGAKAYVTWYALTVFIIPLVVLTFAYSCICQAIWINFSMKNSIRRHQFGRSSRISLDSGENDCHTVVLDNGHPSRTNSNKSVDGGRKKSMTGTTTANSASIIKRPIPYYNNLKELECEEKESNNTDNSPSWRRDLGNRSNSQLGAKTTITTSFTQNLDEDKGGGGHNISNDDKLDMPGYQLLRNHNHHQHNHHHHHHPHHNQRHGRFTSFRDDPRDSDEDDDEIEMNDVIPSFQLCSPQIDKVQIFPNGAKYSTPILQQSRHNSKAGQQQHKLNMNGTNSETNNGITTATPATTPGNTVKEKATRRTYIWSSSKNTNNKKENSSIRSTSSELKSNQQQQQQQQQHHGKSNLKQFLLAPTKSLNNSHSFVSRGSEHNFRKRTVSSTSFRQPPLHRHSSSSVKGISRAKIKTIKLTVTVICCYVFCSSPFIAAQLWATYDPDAMKSPFWTGATFTILTLLASLNSCVNPWIFLFFNPNLLQDFLRGFGCPNLIPMKSLRGNSPNSAAQRTCASPGLITRASRRDTHGGSGVGGGGNRGPDTMERRISQGVHLSVSHPTDRVVRSSLHPMDGSASLLMVPTSDDGKSEIPCRQ